MRIAPLLVAACLLLGCGTPQPTVSSACPPVGYTQHRLLGLKSAGFEVLGATERQRLAEQLLACLASPDPVWRDQVAYESYLALLRGGLLESGTVHWLRAQLLERLGQPDPSGVAQPFAALVLAEVARVDRLQPYLNQTQRTELVAAAAGYLRQVDDYRGFDEVDGWRHGVAHGADLLLQLTLNPALGRTELEQLVAAALAQVNPSQTHFYRYGEPNRLARAVLFAATRGELTDAQWQTWFASLTEPGPFESWGDVFSSQAGLAKLHNTKVFALAIYAGAAASDSAELEPLATASLALLRELP